MEILVSASQETLSMAAAQIAVTEAMSREDFFAWGNAVERERSAGKDYKKSQFNYAVERESRYLLYNTLYHSLTRLDAGEYRRYSELEFADEGEQEAFAEQGLIVPDYVDELGRYNAFVALRSKYVRSEPTLTVAPTLACNASCFYCYENGVRCGNMSVQQAHDLIARLKTLDLTNGLCLTWFGGEPLLNQGWMDHFSDCLRAEGIAFSGFLISNGSLIDDAVIEKMKQSWNIKSVQISLDGDAEEYMRRKAYRDPDAYIYCKVLKTIGRLSRAGIGVSVRLNMDRDNIDSTLVLVDHLERLFGQDGNVSFYPAFLTGSKEPFAEREKIDVAKRIIRADTHNKLPVNRYLYEQPKASACHYYNHTSFAVDTDGYLYRCERMLGHTEKAIGNIGQAMDLSLDERDISGRRRECQECVFLPKCQGGCQAAYEGDDDPCFIEKYVIQAYLEIL